MRKVWLVVLCIIALAISMSQIVAAQGEDDISRLTLNMTGVGITRLTIGMDGVDDSRLVLNTVIIIPELTGVQLYPISVDFGLLRAGDIRSTDYDFTILNASNVTANITIGVSGDWSGGTNWTHADDGITGANTAALRAIVEDSNGHTSVIVRKTEPYNRLVANLAPDDTVSFALEIYAPTELSEYTRKANGIFITVEGE